MKNRIFFNAILLLSALIVFQGCKKKEQEEKQVISIKGSDTMVNLTQKWAENFMAANPAASIQVTGGGSGTGVAALLNGTTDIAASSRELKSKEIDLAKSKNLDYQEFRVALDGIAIIVHPSNPLEYITMEQARDIFSGKITNYKVVSGPDQRITIYGRENSSGTYEFFKDHVLGKDKNGNEVDYATQTQVLQGTAALAEAVAKDKNAIAYGGVGYFALRKDVKIIGVKADEKAEVVFPSKDGVVNYEAIWNGQYSISRYLYLFTGKTPEGMTKTFIDYILSPDGQKVVETMEYIPLPR